jgi:hypothetical protein
MHHRSRDRCVDADVIEQALRTVPEALDRPEGPLSVGVLGLALRRPFGQHSLACCESGRDLLLALS